MAKGIKTGGGSRKGIPNKVSRDLRAAIIESFYQVGGVEYLVGQATANPQAYLSLMGKVIPKEIDATVRGTLNVISPFSD